MLAVVAVAITQVQTVVMVAVVEERVAPMFLQEQMLPTEALILALEVAAVVTVTVVV
jgi:hypothetical protein